MTVINTYKWFLNKPYNVDTVIENVKKHWRNKEESYNSENELKQILLDHGLNFREDSGKKIMKRLQEIKVWSLIKKYCLKYRRIWHGPDVPIFILPIDTNNRQLMKDTNGKSGVAFPAALFLFLSDIPTEKEIEALFVHEYHHVSRFHALKKKSYMTLLDSIVMEGLAEHAVLEYCGENYITKCNKIYSEEQLKNWWKRWFYPNLSTRREKKLHDSLMYGRKMFPFMVGYSVGFFLISEFRKKENFSTKTFIGEPAETFLSYIDEIS
ncbi:DUF2268 domain-containing protein [Bacillus carboniphilus]|uniref:DUF2268 domain-containing protein n=1 Tax=Bacillus carboniphilus TaxID=86663 RepID=A0ABP3FT95_9BACI